jgi:hypothetical protein
MSPYSDVTQYLTDCYFPDYLPSTPYCRNKMRNFMFIPLQTLTAGKRMHVAVAACNSTHTKITNKKKNSKYPLSDMLMTCCTTSKNTGNLCNHRNVSNLSNLVNQKIHGMLITMITFVTKVVTNVHRSPCKVLLSESCQLGIF